MVPSARVEVVADKPVLLRRFDRDGARRIPFLSGMSMLGARDNQAHSYLELVDALRQHGAAPQEDMHALWRRMVFNILISNTDDHLRNHGFLYHGNDGWRLSPAYDLNPVDRYKAASPDARYQRGRHHCIPVHRHGGGWIF